ncbi:MAG: SAM-dependent methyltransferase [Bacteroidetes bacterium]|nr:MAG: SAM-dependent methyltransferase [Bacteroidota bacterium]
MGAIALASRYLKYRLSAKTRFKTHSPFVYDLINQVFRNNRYYSDFLLLDAYVEELKQKDSVIETTDFGAGSGESDYQVYLKSLGKIVKERSHTKTRLHLLYNLMKYFKPETMLEFGTAAGVSSMYLKRGLPESSMVTMEGCPGLCAVARENFKRIELDNIEVSNGNFDVILPEVLQRFKKLDFVFFDGNHREEPTLNYFSQCVEKAHENTLFIFDDIHWSKGMEAAWNAIKLDKRVRLTIDIFWFGLVFFKKGVAKQDFIVKY